MYLVIVKDKNTSSNSLPGFSDSRFLEPIERKRASDARLLPLLIMIMK